MRPLRKQCGESCTREISPQYLQMLTAIEQLPDELRETFELVRIQGLTHTEVASVMDVSAKTVQRRLNHALQMLAEKLEALRPAPPSRPSPSESAGE